MNEKVLLCNNYSQFFFLFLAFGGDNSVDGILVNRQRQKLPKTTPTITLIFKASSKNSGI